MTNRQQHSFLMRAVTLQALLQEAEAWGCTVVRDDKAGTVIVRNQEGTILLRALRKGAESQPWLVGVWDTDDIKFSTTNE